MSSTVALTQADFEQRVETVLRELLGRVPFLQLVSLRRAADVSGAQPDWLVEVDAGERPWVLAVNAQRRSHPRDVRHGLLALQHYLYQFPEKPSYGVMVAPFLSTESARLCAEAKMGYVDLAGNALLSFDQVFIEQRAADNPFRVKRQLRSLFTPKAGRVLRVLITPPLRPWKVTELAASAGVSLGQVSNVRQLLLDREWAVAGDEGLRLSRPEALARAWERAYEPRPRSRETAYTLLHGEALDEAVRAALAEAGGGAHAVLASYSAARWIAPYARHGTQFLYADAQGAEALNRHLSLRRVERGENVLVTEPQEDDVFAGRIEAAPGIWCTGLVQTWLDLSAAGERGNEAAEYLLREKLLPEWQEVGS